MSPSTCISARRRQDTRCPPGARPLPGVLGYREPHLLCSSQRGPRAWVAWRRWPSFSHRPHPICHLGPSNMPPFPPSRAENWLSTTWHVRTQAPSSWGASTPRALSGARSQQKEASRKDRGRPGGPGLEAAGTASTHTAVAGAVRQSRQGHRDTSLAICTRKARTPWGPLLHDRLLTTECSWQ